MKWWNRNRALRYPELWGLMVVALVTRLWQLAQPNAIVFDEVYFREFASHYLDGHYFFDIHPPLVKLLFAGIGSLFGMSAEQIASGGDATFLLRLLPAVAGALLIPLVYLIVRQFGLGRRIAAIAGLMVLLDNAFLVESRFVLMDSLLLVFGIGAVASYLLLRKAGGTKRWLWVAITALLLGMLVSTKWTGLAIVLLLAAAWFIDCVLGKIPWRRMAGEALAVIATIVAIYTGSFALHFALLPQSGEGDAFMSWQYQSTLKGNPGYDASATMPFIAKLVELNREMYASESSIGEHPYASRWHTWPLMVRPVYYWQGQTGDGGAQGNIYMLGNPIVWWGSTAALVCFLVLLLTKPKLFARHRFAAVFLLGGYAVNFLPFALIGRPMFMYHYLFALLFAIMITALLLAVVLDRHAKRYGRKSAMQVYWGITIAVLVGFIYVLPLSYGWPLSPAELQQRMLLPSWR